MAVMPRSFFSYGSKPAFSTASMTAASLLYLRLLRPSTSLKPDHSLPERACCRAYSLMSEAQLTNSSTLPRMTSISASVSSGGSLNSCCASFKFASALARHSFLALQKPHHSPQRKFPSPAKASSAVGFSTSSAQRYRSDLVGADVLASRLVDGHGNLVDVVDIIEKLQAAQRVAFVFTSLSEGLFSLAFTFHWR